MLIELEKPKIKMAQDRYFVAGLFMSISSNQWNYFALQYIIA